MKVAGFVENTCNWCGAIFEVAYYEGENMDAAVKTCCINCIFGVPPGKKVDRRELDVR